MDTRDAGRKGGKAGRGEAKRRGDSAYYKALRAKVKKGGVMSSKQRRVAAHWMAHYNRIMAQPQRGVITYGGGLNVLEAMREAEAQGYHCTMTPAGVILR